MNNNPKISFIVPVYNVEQYLPRCIDSILIQSFRDYEVLLINDGSKDKSGAICDEYASKDSRIIVFHKENGGVSSARNVGLDNARGEWVTFVDADDYLLPNTISKNIINDRYDLIQLRRTAGSYYNPQLKCKQCLKVSGNAIIDIYCHEVWGRIIKKSIIGDIRFCTSLTIGEDLFFNIQILERVNSYRIDNFGGYCYCLNDCSVMHSSNVHKDCFVLLDKVRAFYEQNTLSRVAMFTLLMYFEKYRKSIGLYYIYTDNIPMRYIFYLPIGIRNRIAVLFHYGIIIQFHKIKSAFHK